MTISDSVPARRRADPIEAELSQRLISLLAITREHMARVDNTPGLPVPGSPMRADDRMSPDFTVSHGAYFGVCVATDNLDALRRLSISGEGTPDLEITTSPYAAFPLMRAALEGAAQVGWLLGPSKRKERVRRRLLLALNDAAMQDQAAENVGQPAVQLAKRRTEVGPVADAAGIDLGPMHGRLKQWEVVAAAGEHFRMEHMLFYWNLLSGAAHGDWWAANTLAERVILEDLPGGRHIVRLNAPADRVIGLWLHIGQMVNLAWNLFDRRNTPPFA